VAFDLDLNRRKEKKRGKKRGLGEGQRASQNRVKKGKGGGFRVFELLTIGEGGEKKKGGKKGKKADGLMRSRTRDTGKKREGGGDRALLDGEEKATEKEGKTPTLIGGKKKKRCTSPGLKDGQKKKGTRF